MNNTVDCVDDQYLFRLTSTHGWDDAIFLCESLVLGIETAVAASSRRRGGGQLLAHGHDGSSDNENDSDNGDTYDYFFNDSLGHKNNNQKSLQQWLRQAHQQLFYLDQWGNYPLHAASYVKPPLNVIDALFRLARAIWEHSSYYRGQCTPIWATPCSDGSTPFLVACSTGASSSVLHRYLDEIEFYIEKQWVEHPKLARMLVVQPDNQGSTPLTGWMGFHGAWIKRQLEQPRGNSLQSDSHHIIPRLNREQASSQHLSDYWNIACRMLIFPTMYIRPHYPPMTPVLIHRCAAIAMYCPVSLLEWVVAPHAYNNGKHWLSADTSAATADSLGKLPMHRAMEAVDSFAMFDEGIVHHGIDFDASEMQNSGTNESPATMPTTETHTATTVDTTETMCPREDAILYNNPKLEKNRVQIITKLLRWHPKAATTCFGNGRSPLIQAIAHGGTWHQLGYTYKVSGGNSSKDTKGLLQVLWRYAPEQLLEIDPVTKLYPFMLAASKSRCGNYRDNDMVDTVYNLLRKDPQLIAGALPIGLATP